uniref:Putative apolipoprotein D n=1 Tax=Maconellicoccus hirsutus TaxID=177089 RepID=A2I467_MACHI|nr:putative apolipoprotein D [Maconellicoccus hirsutus]
MYSVLKLCAVLILHQSLVNAHSYHLGEKCLDVEPVKSFDISRFSGIWYAIEKTSTGSKCLLYNITATDLRKVYNITQVSVNPIVGLVKDHLYRYQGSLEISDETKSGKLTVKFPLSIPGSASFIIFDTDYDSYAGVYSCQSLGVGHRQAAMILSRKNTLDKTVINKLRDRLSRDQVNPFDLSIISHDKCNYNTNFSLEINQHTFSKDNLKNAAKSVGHAVADGADFVYQGAKKLYHYVKKDPKEIENEKLKEYLLKRKESNKDVEELEFYDGQYNVPTAQGTNFF